MPPLIIYLLKLSLALGLVYLFYHFVLRRLTFYTWNRWYLMGYSLLCFFLPFIDISLALEDSEMKNSPVVNWVPVLGEQIFLNKEEQSNRLNGWDYALLILLAGVMIMLIRLCIQLISIRRMRNRSSLISKEGIRVYQVNAPIIPFSFGDSIFINQQQHSTAELEEIIRHEFVHVKEKHSVDIIWGELLCIFNWYNPFAWFLKKTIRQNLEFIADRRVLEQGMDRKQYQYLLLKVIGNNHFSIANQFNFSSLKKRIAMMNKLRTARIHLVRFLFILPLLSVLLLAFRSQWDAQADPVAATYDVQDKVTTQQIDNSIAQTITDEKLPEDTLPRGGVNKKGYLISVTDTKGTATVVVKDAQNNVVKRILLSDWNSKPDYYKRLYGTLPPPPPPTPPADAISPVDVQGFPVSPAAPVEVVTVQGYKTPAKAPAAPVEVVTVQGYKTPAKAPATPVEVVTVQGYKTPAVNEVIVTGYAKPARTIAPLPENVESILVKQGNKVEVQLKNGKKEFYDLNNLNEKKKFNAKYPVPPPPPPAPAPQPIEVRGYKTNTSVAVEGKPLPENLIYVINGRISTKSEMEQLKPEQIASVDILKGNSAVAVYGDKAKDGVVQIKLKNEASPLYVIDGEIASKEKTDQLKPEQIESINVLKGEKATAVYGDNGKNGVIVIRTKK